MLEQYPLSERKLVYRVLHKHLADIDLWQGDSRGNWEGDTFVVDTVDFNDKTWFDMSGNFHSEALKVTERYSLADADTLRYEATITDPKVFTRPWKMSMPIYRVKDVDRIFEYQCVAEGEEASGAFHREPKTWYPK